MSLLDYAPRTEPEYRTPEVRLYMRLSRRRSLALFAATIFVIALFAIIYVGVVDPDWRPKHIRGKGAWLVLLLFLLPVFWRAVALWMLGGLATFGLIARTVRLGDEQIDYIIGPDGITNTGLLYSRKVAWSHIDHIEIHRQSYLTAALVKPTPGAKVEIVERFRGISTLHLFGRGTILIPLELVSLSADQFVEIVHRFRPDLTIRNRPVRRSWTQALANAVWQMRLKR